MLLNRVWMVNNLNMKKTLFECLYGLLAVALLTFIDQITKILAVSHLSDGPFTLIKGVFELRYINNYGAAWGILSGKRAFFIIITVIIMLIFSYIYFKTPKNKYYTQLLFCELLLVSGALGNFIDRVWLGYVRDFLYFSLIDFPIFNIADCYVVISAIWLAILVLFVYKDEDFNFLSNKKKGDS